MLTSNIRPIAQHQHLHQGEPKHICKPPLHPAGPHRDVELTPVELHDSGRPGLGWVSIPTPSSAGASGTLSDGCPGLRLSPSTASTADEAYGRSTCHVHSHPSVPKYPTVCKYGNNLVTSNATRVVQYILDLLASSPTLPALIGPPEPHLHLDPPR